MENTLKILSVAAIAHCLFSCSPSYKSYPPDFIDNGTSFHSLTSKYGVDAIEFETYPEVDTADSTLSISLIYSKTKPSVESRNAYAKEIAAQIKDVLRTPERYSNYLIVFVHRQRGWLLSSDSFEPTEIAAKDL